MIPIRFDEDLSVRFVDALAALSTDPEIILEHPNRRGEAGLSDVDWIPAFAGRGGRCIVSANAKMRDVPAERAALEASGLIAVFPPRKGWLKDLKLMGQAAFWIRWFPTIVELARTAAPGEHFRLPPTFTGRRSDVLILPRLAPP